MLRLGFIGTDGQTADLITVARDLRNVDVIVAAAGREADVAGVDAVVIAQSDASGAAVATAAQAGAHVLLAAPAAESHAAIRAAIDLCSSANVRLMLAHSWRFEPAADAVLQSLRSGELGRPGLLRSHRWLAGDGHVSATAPSDGPVAGVITAALRDIDMALWIFAGLPQHVYAVTRHGRAAEAGEPDYAQIHLGFDGGGMALIDLAVALPESSDPYASLTLVGSAGTAYADDHHNMQLLFQRDHPAALRTATHPVALRALLKEFTDAIAADRAPSVSGDDGAAAALVCEAVQAAAATRRAQALQGSAYAPV